MRKMTRAQLFAAPANVRRAEARLARGKSAVVAARARASDITEQYEERPFNVRPTVLQRRRLAERLSR
jgi:hypothetical protein